MSLISHNRLSYFYFSITLLQGAAEASLQQQLSPDEAAALAQQQALQTAKLLLSENEIDGENNSLQNVHSTKSVVTLLKTAKEKIAQVRDQVKGLKPGTPAEPKVNNEVGTSPLFDRIMLDNSNKSVASCVYFSNSQEL